MADLSVQEDKLLMMGGMFENIIHQFKQPLNAINTEATGLKFQKEIGLLDDATFLESLDNIVQSTKYLSDTIDDFRDFLKEDRIKEYFHVKKVIEQIESIIKPLLNAKGIVVEKFFTRETIEINGFPREFSQVIINILNNAKDAILSNNNYDKIIRINVDETETNVIVTISDNGGGIPHDVLPHIFKSHFTTKSDSGGTGIGLCMSESIIKEHFNGKIEAKNSSIFYNEKEYNGASFIIDVPKNI